MINETRLLETFLDLVAIDSPSGQEEAISKDLARRLAELGGEVETDEHWNLIARWPQGQGDWLHAQRAHGHRRQRYRHQAGDP